MSQSATASTEKNISKTHIEDCESISTPPDLKSEAITPAVGDYSGAVAKSDPVEIALVKKLDWRIMPTLWCMYFLNYVSTPQIISIFPLSNTRSA
jgi:hypothetical protein